MRISYVKMATDRVLRKGNDYQTYFEPNAYCDFYYKKVDGPVFIQFVVESLHKIYKTGKINGKCLLEIGSRPTIHTVIPAAKWFDEIILSDFTPANRDAVNKWFNGNQDVHNWDPFFEYYSHLQGTEGWGDMATDLRNKVKKILPCDVHLPNPVNPVVLSNSDAICTSLCLESASPDIASFGQAMKNVVTMLKPGGKFILVGVLQNPFYTVGSEKFHCLALKKDDILDAIASAGMTTLEMFEDDTRLEGDIAPLEGAVVILAEKKM